MQSDGIRLVEYLHPEMDRKFRTDDKYECHSAILGTWSEEVLSDRMFTKDDFFSEISDLMGMEDFYFSVNSFYCARRKTENVRHLNAIVLDYDFYKLDQFKELTAAEMLERIRPSLPADPSFVVDSGRGLYIIFALEHCPYQLTDLYRSVVNTLQKQQEIFGADPKATLVTQVIRIPGTRNSKSGRSVEIIEFNDKRYTLSFLADKVLPFSRSEVTQWKKKRKSVQMKSVFQNHRQSNFEKDLKQLIALRNDAGIETGYREQLIYLYWESLLWANKKEEVIINKISQMNALFLCPLSDQQLFKQCKPARKYKFRTSKNKIISKLSITEEEMQSLKVLVSADIHRKKLMRKSRRTMGLTDKKKQLKNRREEIIRCLGSKKIDEMADLFGVSKKTILRDLKYIAEHLSQFQKVLREIMRQKVNKAAEFIQMVITLSCDVTWSGIPEIGWSNGAFVLL